MTVLILGHEADAHANHVSRGLVERGAKVEFLDSDDFPAQMYLHFDPRTGQGAFDFPSGNQVAFSDVKSVYWRAIGPPGGETFIARNDSRSLFESIVIDLPARWVNGWEGFQLHQRKPAAMKRAVAAGAKVPATLYANDRFAVREFAERHPNVIFKPVQGGAHARPLTDLSDKRLATLRKSPVALQEKIEGTNVRLFVFDELVVGLEIRTQALDFRDDPKPEIRAFDVEPALAALAVRVARASHLLWSGIDFIRAVDGEYYFLEANPSPMFIGFEKASGLPLTQHLLDLLLR